MRPTRIVGTVKQPHAAFQGSQALGYLPTLVCQAHELLAYCVVRALDKGGIEQRSSARSRKQHSRLFQGSLHQLARDVYYAFLFLPFNHHPNTQLWPHSQRGVPASCRLFDASFETSAGYYPDTTACRPYISATREGIDNTSGPASISDLPGGGRASGSRHLPT
jgi:hypothetical protein